MGPKAKGLGKKTKQQAASHRQEGIFSWSTHPWICDLRDTHWL